MVFYCLCSFSRVNKKLMRLSVDGRVNAKRSSILFDESSPIPSENETILTDPAEETTVGRVKVKKLVNSETRFPRIEEMSHFHYNNVDFPGKMKISVLDETKFDGSSETSEKHASINVSCSDSKWTIKRTYQDLIGLDRQLHRCIYDRSFSNLKHLGELEQSETNISNENMREIIEEYIERLDEIAGNNLNCGPILNWLEIDNHGNHLVVMEADDSAINVPAIAAAHVIKRYVAQAPDEISLEVGEFVSVIDMPPGEETIWWRGKKGFEVGFFPSSCVDILIDKELDSKLIQHVMIQRPISKRRGKFISFLRYFFRSRPSKDELMQTGILRERTFGCDLGEHLAGSGREIPLVLEMCTSVIEESGIVDGIYRLSGITSNMQKLRLAFDNEEPPNLQDTRYLHDIHCISSLLKTYFRELPNPLLTYELYDKFMAAIRKNDDTERTVAFHHAIQRLPPPHYRTLEFLLRHLEKCASYSHMTNMNEKNLAIVWAPNLLRPNVKEPGGAALLDIRNQAIIIEYLLKNVGIFFDKNLASAAIAFYPETEEIPVSTGDSGSGSKDFVLDRTSLEKIGSSPPKLISLTEARTRLKENNRICQLEKASSPVERPRRKSRPPSNPTIPASIPISPGPSLLSLEEAQARSRGKVGSMLRRGSLDFNQIECRPNKENFAELTPKKRSWKGLFSRNKSISNELCTYSDEKKTMSISTFKRRVSYDVGHTSGLSTPRSQSSFNLRELGPNEVNGRPASVKKGRKKKLEISSPLGIRTSSFVSYVGGMSQLERTSTAPEIDLRQAARAARSKSAFGKTLNDTVDAGGSAKDNGLDKKREAEYISTLEVINDVSIDETGSINADDSVPSSDSNEGKSLKEATCELDKHVSKNDFIELNKLIVDCSDVDNGSRRESNSASPVDEKSLRNSMWIEKYDEIARSCSSAAPSTAIDGESLERKPLSSTDTRPGSSQSYVSTISISPRHRSTSEIRDSILSRGSRELQSSYVRNVSKYTEKRSQSVDLSNIRQRYGKTSSCTSDDEIPNSNDTGGVLTIDWVPVMQRSLTTADDFKNGVGVHCPIERCCSTGCYDRDRLSQRQLTSRPFSSYDNHPLPQNDDTGKLRDRKTKNRPSMYDNLLLID